MSAYKRVDNDQEEALTGELMLFSTKQNRTYRVRILNKFAAFSARWSDIVKGYVPCDPNWKSGNNKAKKIWATEVLDLNKNEVRVLQLDWGGYQHFTQLPKEQKFDRDLTISYTAPVAEGAFGEYKLEWAEPNALTAEQKAIAETKHITVEEYFDKKTKEDNSGVPASSVNTTNDDMVDSLDEKPTEIDQLNFGV